MQGAQEIERKKIPIILFLIGVCVIYASFVGYSAWLQHNDSKEYFASRAKNDLEKNSKIMEVNFGLLINSVDSMLKRVVDKQYTNILFGKTIREDVKNNISLWVDENPFVESMIVTDGEGKIEVIYAEDNPKFDIQPGTVFAVDEILRHIKPEDKSQFFIHLLKSKSSNGESNIIIGRKMLGVDGSLKGIVAAVVSAEHITRDFATDFFGNSVNVALIFDNSDIVTSSNNAFTNQEAIRALINDPKIFEDETKDISYPKDAKEVSEVKDNKASISADNVYISEQKTDNDNINILSLQKLKSLPVYIALSINNQDLSGAWNVDLKRYYKLIALLSFALLAIVTFVIVLFKNQQASSNLANNSLRLMHGKSNYFVKASEKLVTPIHAITGFSQMLSEGYFGPINKEQKQRLHDIQQCSGQVLDLISNVSELISADVGAVCLKEEQVDITSIIIGSIQLLAPKLHEQRITLVDNTMKSNTIIQADSRRIRHMVLHILSNAVQYTPAGGKIVVSTFYDAQQNFVFEVLDSGSGIDKNELRRILQPFETDLEADKESRKISIGLPLCQLYAMLHGGKLEIKTKLGSGTKITIVLPKQRITEQRVQVYSSMTVEV